MNILITTFSFPSLELGHYDGKFVLAEAKAYAENGAEVKVLTPHYPGANKKEFIGPNIEVVRFSYFLPYNRQRLKQPGKPIYGSKSPLALFQIPILLVLFTFHILRLARWADIIHAQWTATALLALPAKYIFKTPVVMTARGSDLRLLPHKINRFIHRHVDGVIDCFGPQPWNIKNKKQFPANYIKLPLLVDSESSLSPPKEIGQLLNKYPNIMIVIYIGRIDHYKIKENNLPLLDLVHAAKILLRKKVDFHIIYIGGGDQDLIKKINNLVIDNNLSSAISILGPKLKVNDYIKYSHIGIGGIALNAVSQEFIINEKPQLLINNKDNKEMPWKHRQNTIFVNKNDITNLYEKLYWASQNRKKISAIGKQAKKDFENLVVENKKGGKHYLNSFNNLLC